MTPQSYHLPAWQQTPATGYLTPVETAQLDRLFDRLFPEDPARHWPGAVKAGAARFVSLLLARDVDTYWEIPKWRTNYRAWLAALDAWATQTHGQPLANLAPDRLDALMGGLETGTTPGLALDLAGQQLLFKTLLRHCYQGCFGDPRWGGNQNKIVWRALGYLQQPETTDQIAQDPLPALPL